MWLLTALKPHALLFSFSRQADENIWVLSALALVGDSNHSSPSPPMVGGNPRSSPTLPTKPEPGSSPCSLQPFWTSLRGYPDLPRDINYVSNTSFYAPLTSVCDVICGTFWVGSSCLCRWSSHTTSPLRKKHFYASMLCVCTYVICVFVYICMLHMFKCVCIRKCMCCLYSAWLHGMYVCLCICALHLYLCA